MGEEIRKKGYLYKKSELVLTRPFYAKFRKHNCSKCGGRLKLTWVTHYGVKKGSRQAICGGLTYDVFNNPIDYKFGIFKCSECSAKFSIDDQYYFEKPQKLEKDNNKYGDYRNRDPYHIYLADIEVIQGK